MRSRFPFRITLDDPAVVAAASPDWLTILVKVNRDRYNILFNQCDKRVNYGWNYKKQEKDETNQAAKARVLLHQNDIAFAKIFRCYSVGRKFLLDKQFKFAESVVRR